MNFKNVLIVLGCSSRKDGRPSDCMVSRARKAVHLYKRENYSRVILSGGPSCLVIPESEIMRIMLLRFIPSGKLITERHSRSTVQNAVFCWELLKDRHSKKITVLTSEHHLPRARYIFRKLYSHMGVSLYFESAPDNFDPIESLFYRIKEFFLLSWQRLFGVC
ncbi:MAG: YdcF family protein [Nanoarchaeota archaeon]